MSTELFIPTPHQSKVWAHYNATIAKCNNVLCTVTFEDYRGKKRLVGFKYWSLDDVGLDKHMVMDIKKFCTEPSDHYSKGTFYGEWIWKNPELKQ